MVDSSRRRRSRRGVMTNHNRCWIWGRNVVLETLRSGRWPVIELLVGDRADDTLWNEVAGLANGLGIEAVSTTDATLAKECRSNDHQGLAACMAPFPYLTVDALLKQLPAKPLIVVLDRLQDPFNFGAIVRSASTLGVHGIIIGNREQCEVNSLVARSSAGAINHIGIAQSHDLAQTTEQLRGRGFQVVAATEKSTTPLHTAKFSKPTVCVIGNEGKGIRPDLLQICDVAVAIPMSGQVGSLNAAVAAGILFYETRRQRLAAEP